MGCCTGSNFTPAPDAALDPLQRVNYTFGMVLGVDDFRQEHAYLAARDERALRETIGDMTALYLTRKLYTGLPYDFSTTSNSCNFASIGLGTSAVHSPNCINSATQISWFDDHRPSYSASKACNYNAGYRMGSVNQAVWQYLNRRRCSVVRVRHGVPG